MSRFTKCLIVFLAFFSLIAVACHPKEDYTNPCPAVGTPKRHLIDLVRDYRRDHGKGGLFCNDYAAVKAQDWANKYADQVVNGHSTLENGYPKAADWGHQYWCWLGENMGASWSGNGNFDDAVLEAIFQNWTASQSHRDILLGSKATFIGVGYKVNGDFLYAVLEMGGHADAPECANSLP